MLDDVQWADEDSAHLLSDVLSVEPRVPVALVCAHRDGGSTAYLDTVQRRWLMAPDMVELPLPPLEPDDAGKLVRLTSAGKLDPGAVARVVVAGEGNPGMLLALTGYALATDGALEGPWKAGDIMVGQFAGLTAAARAVMSQVALAEGPLQDRTLRRIAVPYGGTRTVIQLKIRGLLRDAGRTAAAATVLYHAGLREPCLAALSEQDTRAMRRALLDSLLSTDAEPGLMVSQHLALGERDHAVRAAALASEAAAEQLAWLEVARWQRQIGEMSEEPERVLDSWKAGANACAMAGHVREAGERYLRASELASHPTARAALQQQASAAWILAGDVRRGLDVVEPRLAVLGASGQRGTLRLAGSVLVRLALVTWSSTIRNTPWEREAREDAIGELYWGLAKGLAFIEPIRGLEYTVRCLARAVRLRDGPRFVQSASFLAGSVLLQMPLTGWLGRHWLRQADEVSQGQDELEATLMLWRGLHAVGPGDWDVAERCFQEALEVFDRHPDGRHWERHVALSLATWLRFLDEDWNTLRTTGEAGHLDALERGDAYAAQQHEQYLAAAALAADRPEVCASMMARIREAWSHLGYSPMRLYGLLFQVRAACYQGRLGLARQLWADEQPVIRSSGSEWAAVVIIDNRTEEARLILLEAGRDGLTPQRVRRLERIVKMLERQPRPDGHANARWIRAALALGGDDEGPMLEEVAAAFAGTRMQGCALVMRHHARRRQGLDTVEVDDQLRARGVASPERWCRYRLPLGDQAVPEEPTMTPLDASRSAASILVGVAPR